MNIKFILNIFVVILWFIYLAINWINKSIFWLPFPPYLKMTELAPAPVQGIHVGIDIWIGIKLSDSTDIKMRGKKWQESTYSLDSVWIFNGVGHILCKHVELDIVQCWASVCTRCYQKVSYHKKLKISFVQRKQCGPAFFTRSLMFCAGLDQNNLQSSIINVCI